MISDWMMPGMDGIELCRKIRENKKGGYVYFIMLTQKSAKKDLLDGFNAGVDAYLKKPPEPDLLEVQLNVGRRIVALERQLLKEKEKVSQYATKMENLAEDRAQQLIHADRMATLGILSAGIAHEVNNPTAFISGNIQTLEKFWTIQEQYLLDCPKDVPQKEKIAFIIEEMPRLIQGIKNGASRISRIVNGLKFFARQDKPKRIPFDLHQTLEEALLLCQYKLKFGITIIKAFCDDLPSFWGDPQQLEQVFINIFNNAADAMEGMPKGQLRIQTQTSGDQIRILIADSGMGIPLEMLSKLWTPFFTTKSIGKGTGLGMSISKGIIEAHGGRIDAYPQASGGMAFEIVLPLKENAS